MFYQDEVGSTDTSTDDGTDPSSADGLDPSEVYQDYVFAKRRWRRMSNKYPRRYRKFGRSGKAGGKGFKPSSYAAFLPPNAFAGGKGGSSSHKGGFRRKNPKDKTGQIMKCNICGSDEHLWRRCPNKPKDSNSYPAGSASGATNLMQRPGQGQLALMTSRPSIWGSTSAAAALPGVHFFGAEMENLRSVSQVGSQAGSVVSSGGSKRASADNDVETASAGIPAPDWSPGRPPPSQQDFPTSSGVNPTEVTPLVEGARMPAFPPPSEMPSMPQYKQARRGQDPVSNDYDATYVNMSGAASAAASFVASAVTGFAPTPHVTDRPTGQPTGSSDPCGSAMSDGGIAYRRSDRDEQRRIRDQNIAGLHNVLMQMEQRHGANEPAAEPMPQIPHPNTRGGMRILFPTTSATFTANPEEFDGPTFPWWERDDVMNQQASATYHLRTRRANGTVGLLIDPGAHDNLIGGATASQMSNELNAKLEVKPMNRSLPVEGVGKTAQVADTYAKIHMQLEDVLGTAVDASYTAPIIQDSPLPPLLGNKTLRKMQVILDCGSGKMIIPGPGGVEVKMSPGSNVFDLELTSSGHWVLPLLPEVAAPQRKTKSEQELAFSMTCRSGRSASPKRPPGAEASMNSN